MVARAVVCGAGTAGLGAAAELGRRGVEVVVLEQSDQVGASWRARYDDLKLNTPGWMSSMPGYRATIRRYGEFPTRDDWVRYIEDYTTRHAIEVQHGTTVHRIDREGDRWTVDVGGRSIAADIVVVALGMERRPVIPDWPGRESFRGDLIHAADFRNAASYRGRDVLVVGPNVTGTEIANLLAESGAKRVRVACRTPPNLVRRKFLGVSVNLPGIVLNRLPARFTDEISWLMQRIMFGSLDRYGIPRSPQGIGTMARERRRSPAYDNGFVDELKAGRIEIVAAVADLDGADVVLADRARIRPEAVIAATGYRPAIEPLVGHLGALSADGFPTAHGGEQHPDRPNLFFIGYRGDLSGQMRLMRLDARAIGRAARRARKQRAGRH